MSNNRFKTPSTSLNSTSQSASVNKPYHLQSNKNSEFNSQKKGSQPPLPVSKKPSFNKIKPVYGVNKPPPLSQRPNLPEKPSSINKAQSSPVNRRLSDNRNQRVMGRPQPPQGRNGPPPPPPSRFVTMYTKLYTIVDYGNMLKHKLVLK